MIQIQALRARFAAIPAPIRGIILMAISGAAFSVMHGFIRHVTQEIHPFEAAFFRMFFGLVALAPVFMAQGLAPLRTTKLKLFSIRAVLNVIAMMCFFYGLSLTPLAQATALGFSAPIFATLMAMLFLGETVRARRWTAIGIGFLGTLVILRPGLAEIGIGSLLILFSAAVWSIALMVIKVLTRTEGSVTITAYASIMLTPVTFVIAWPFWTWPTPELWIILFLLGAIGTIAQTLLNQALKIADASVVLPVEFSRLIWAALIGFMMFGEIPNIYVWTGGFMIFASTTYIGVREARLKREQRQASG